MENKTTISYFSDLTSLAAAVPVAAANPALNPSHAAAAAAAAAAQAAAVQATTQASVVSHGGKARSSMSLPLISGR